MGWINLRLRVSDGRVILFIAPRRNEVGCYSRGTACIEVTRHFFTNSLESYFDK